MREVNISTDVQENQHLKHFRNKIYCSPFPLCSYLLLVIPLKKINDSCLMTDHTVIGLSCCVEIFTAVQLHVKLHPTTVH